MNKTNEVVVGKSVVRTGPLLYSVPKPGEPFAFFCVGVADPTGPDWYIISIKAQDEPFELPMNPIT